MVPDLFLRRQRGVACSDRPPPRLFGGGHRQYSVLSGASSSALRNRGADRVFRVESLRPKQHEAVEALVFGDELNGKLIVVDRTGGGKSLILQMAGISVAGVTLVIVPLLSLTANQMARITRARTNDMDIHAFHLDESSIDDVKKV